MSKIYCTFNGRQYAAKDKFELMRKLNMFHIGSTGCSLLAHEFMAYAPLDMMRHMVLVEAEQVTDRYKQKRGAGVTEAVLLFAFPQYFRQFSNTVTQCNHCWNDFREGWNRIK